MNAQKIYELMQQGLTTDQIIGQFSPQEKETLQGEVGCSNPEVFTRKPPQKSTTEAQAIYQQMQNGLTTEQLIGANEEDLIRQHGAWNPHLFQRPYKNRH